MMVYYSNPLYGTHIGVYFIKLVSLNPAVADFYKTSARTVYDFAFRDFIKYSKPITNLTKLEKLIYNITD
jgi:hypothetical protein